MVECPSSGLLASKALVLVQIYRHTLYDLSQPFCPLFLPSGLTSHLGTVPSLQGHGHSKGEDERSPCTLGQQRSRAAEPLSSPHPLQQVFEGRGAAEVLLHGNVPKGNGQGEGIRLGSGLGHGSGQGLGARLD